MALGKTRDYKTRDNLIKRKLKAHDNRMKILIRCGYDKETASKMAFIEIKQGVLNY